MRDPRRIPIVLKFFRENPVQLSMFLFSDKLTKSPELTKEFEKFWKKYPDLRLGQALININLIPDGQAWFKEEVDWLLDMNYLDVGDIMFWGINYYKNGNLRKTTKYKLLRDLDTDHIKNIVKLFKDINALDKLHKRYLNYFNNRINEDR